MWFTHLVFGRAHLWTGTQQWSCTILIRATSSTTAKATIGNAALVLYYRRPDWTIHCYADFYSVYIWKIQILIIHPCIKQVVRVISTVVLWKRITYSHTLVHAVFGIPVNFACIWNWDIPAPVFSTRSDSFADLKNPSSGWTWISAPQRRSILNVPRTLARFRTAARTAMSFWPRPERLRALA